MTGNAQPSGRNNNKAECRKLVDIVRSMGGRREAERWKRAAEEQRSATGVSRMKVQVCPHGCSHQLARRDVVTRTRFSGRVDIRIEWTFETSHCSKCGSAFQRDCGRCKEAIYAPVADRCEACGFPHPWAAERRAVATRSQPRQWRSGEGNPLPAELVAKPREGRELLVVEGDITAFDIDAVISNDDVNGRMWATVASAIKASAGSDIERDSVSRGPYPLRSAWPTYAGNLPAKMIIHVAAMDRNGMDGGLDTIEACIRPALDLAVDKGMESVAIATIGTGFQRIKINDWLATITPKILEYLRSEDDKERCYKKLAVLLVLYEPDDFGQLLQLLTEVVAP